MDFKVRNQVGCAKSLAEVALYKIFTVESSQTADQSQ